MKVLYDSSDVHSAIKRVLTKTTSDDRRVVTVAYIGKAAEDFLVHPDGLQIICCLKPGATCPQALRRLHKRGAKLFHSPQLHMKVYWSKSNGCVITSANASKSALGKGGLIEAGVWVRSSKVDIDLIIKNTDCAPIKQADLRKLDRKSDHYHSSAPVVGKSSRRKPPLFDEWRSSYARKSWTLGWYNGGAPIAKASEDEAYLRHGSRAVNSCMNCCKGKYKPGDWILAFHVARKGVSPEWIYADFVVEVPKDDPAHDPDYPYQAVQAHAPNSYPNTPFNVGRKRFKAALEATVEQFGATKIRELESVRPPKTFMRLLKSNWDEQSS